MKMFPIPVAFAFALSLAGFGAADLHAQDAEQPLDAPQELQLDIVSHSVEGEVVEAENGAVSVLTEDGETLTFRIEYGTEVVGETGQPLAEAERNETLEGLDAGDIVVVEYEEGATPDELVATSIEIRSTGGPADL